MVLFRLYQRIGLYNLSSYRGFCSFKSNTGDRPFHSGRFEQEWRKPELKGFNTIEQEGKGTSPTRVSSNDQTWRQSGANLNRVILIGYVGRDPDTKTLSSSTNAWNFPLSTAYKKKAGTGKEETVTDWHNVTVYATPSTTFLNNIIQKGNQLFIEGSLHSSTYTDETGRRRKRYEISVSMEGKGDIRLLNRSRRYENTVVEANQVSQENPRQFVDFQPVTREN
eukprot:jgi/Galph1/2853/GphlegSOOS_G1509.1